MILNQDHVQRFLTAKAQENDQNISLVKMFPNFDQVSSPISFNVFVTSIRGIDIKNGVKQIKSFKIKMIVSPSDPKNAKEVYRLIKLVKCILKAAYQSCCLYSDQITLKY